MAKGRYFETFSAVESQQTFYQLPMVKTALKWRDEAPEGFEFTMKASQLITHEPSSPPTEGTSGRYPRTGGTITAFSRARRRLWEPGRQAKVMVFQCPPSFTPSPENKRSLERFFQAIDRGDLPLVWEPRGDWRPGEIGRTCRDLEPVHGVDPLKVEPLHGKTGYSYRFTDEDLQLLREWSEGGPTYCMFNNVSMFEYAKRFGAIISAYD